MNTLERTKPRATKPSEAMANGTDRDVSGVKIEAPNGPGTNPGKLFAQMVAAVADYPATYVSLEIIGVGFTGDVLNESETANCRVRITNNGPFDLTAVTLRISGQSGATVRNGGLVPFVSSYITGELPTIAAQGGSLEYGSLQPFFKAPAEAQASKTLVKVTLEDWTLSLKDALIGHRDIRKENAVATYAAEVVAS